MWCHGVKSSKLPGVPGVSGGGGCGGGPPGLGIGALRTWTPVAIDTARLAARHSGEAIDTAAREAADWVDDVAPALEGQGGTGFPSRAALIQNDLASAASFEICSCVESSRAGSPGSTRPGVAVGDAPPLGGLTVPDGGTGWTRPGVAGWASSRLAASRSRGPKKTPAEPALGKADQERPAGLVRPAAAEAAPLDFSTLRATAAATRSCSMPTAACSSSCTSRALPNLRQPCYSKIASDKCVPCLA